MIWHDETNLPKTDLVVLPGGFSYGDYLRTGSIASKSKIINDVIKHAKKGGLIFDNVENQLNVKGMTCIINIKDISKEVFKFFY